MARLTFLRMPYSMPCTRPGCDDAMIAHHRLDFAREADSLSEALESAKADAESVPGVHVLSVHIDSAEISIQDKQRTAKV